MTTTAGNRQSELLIKTKTLEEWFHDDELNVTVTDPSDSKILNRKGLSLFIKLFIISVSANSSHGIIRF